MKKLVVGCGYLGSRVAQLWLGQGAEVYTLTRSAERAETLAAQGLQPLVGDILKPRSLPRFPEVETVLFSVGYGGGKQSIREVYVQGLQNTLSVLPDSVQRFIYTSSTGVYGRQDGNWVDEDSPCRPTREGGQAVLQAEQSLAASLLGKSSIVLRLAGLYGPGRIPRQDDLLAGRPLAVPDEGYLNLIHVEDAATAVLAAEEVGSPPRCYLISDGSPTTRRDFYCHLAHTLGAVRPNFIDPPPDDPVSQRATSDKRISNRRMLKELQVHLKYPSFREGLAASVTANSPRSGIESG